MGPFDEETSEFDRHMGDQDFYKKPNGKIKTQVTDFLKQYPSADNVMLRAVPVVGENGNLDEVHFALTTLVIKSVSNGGRFFYALEMGSTIDPKDDELLMMLETEIDLDDARQFFGEQIVDFSLLIRRPIIRHLHISKTL